MIGPEEGGRDIMMEDEHDIALLLRDRSERIQYALREQFFFSKGLSFGGPSRAKFFFSLSGRFHQMLEGPAAIGFFAFSAPTSFAVGRGIFTMALRGFRRRQSRLKSLDLRNVNLYNCFVDMPLLAGHFL